MEHINKIEGIAFSITDDILKQISTRKEGIFPKFMPHESIPKNLKQNKKLFFYKQKRIIGEAKIKELKLLKPDLLIKDYKKDILISFNNLIKYIGIRKNKLVLLLFVKDITVYKKPILLDYYVTMGGKYIFKKEYSFWFRNGSIHKQK